MIVNCFFWDCAVCLDSPLKYLSQKNKSRFSLSKGQKTETFVVLLLHALALAIGRQ